MTVLRRKLVAIDMFENCPQTLDYKSGFTNVHILIFLKVAKLYMYSMGKQRDLSKMEKETIMKRLALNWQMANRSCMSMDASFLLRTDFGAQY